MEEDKKFLLECDCGCGFIQSTHYKDDDNLYLSYYALGFYVHQPNWKERMKMLWAVIRNKEYCLYDIVIPADKMDEFKNYVANI